MLAKRYDCVFQPAATEEQRVREVWHNTVTRCFSQKSNEKHGMGSIEYEEKTKNAEKL